jgi:hypothetical protein
MGEQAELREAEAAARHAPLEERRDASRGEAAVEAGADRHGARGVGGQSLARAAAWLSHSMYLHSM